jgi:hypothetical protein
MTQFLIKCGCGHQRRVTESSIGLVGKCPKCGRELVVTEDALRPAEDEVSPFVAEEAQAPSPFARDENELFEYQPANRGPHCARCGKPFRGDWDMRQTDEGVLCNICANRAHEHTGGEGSPLPTAAQRAEIEATIQENQEATVARQVAVEQAKREEDARRIEKSFLGIPEDRMRRAALLGAGVVLLLCFYYAFLAEPSAAPPPETEAAATAPQDQQLPAAVGYVVWGIGLAASLVAEFIALYMVLRWAKKLPNDVFRYDLVAVGLAAIIIWLVRLVPFKYIPLLGIVMIGVREVIVLYALHEVYRLDFAELVTYLIIHILIPLPITIVKTFLLAGIAYMFL